MTEKIESFVGVKMPTDTEISSIMLQMQEDEAASNVSEDLVMESSMPQDTIDWYKINQALFDLYLAASSPDEVKRIAEKMLETNEKALKLSASKIEIRQYGGILDSEDLLQEIKMAYLEELARLKQSGKKKYPYGIYVTVQNAVKKHISDNCSIVSMPYGTKKRFIKNGTYVMPAVISVNDCEAGTDETGIENRKAAFMSSVLSTEDVVIDKMTRSLVSNTVRDALSALEPNVRDMIILRAMGEEWGSIGERYELTEGGVRFKVNEALLSIRHMCEHMDIDPMDAYKDWTK